MWPPAIADQLRRRGHDTVAVLERSELARQSDMVVFTAAQAEERVLLTEDAGDFRIIAINWMEMRGGHWGLIFTSNRSFPRSNDRTPGRLVTALDA